MNELREILSRIIGKKAATKLLKCLEEIGDPMYLLRISSEEEIANYIGEKPAQKVIAAMRLWRVVSSTSTTKRLYASSPAAVYAVLSCNVKVRQECVQALYLNQQQEILSIKTLNIGTSTESLVDFNELFRWALILNAPKTIVAHNHPAESLEPSPEDISFTRGLIRAGNTLHIEVIDSLILASDSFLSMRERYSYLWN